MNLREFALRQIANSCSIDRFGNDSRKNTLRWAQWCRSMAEAALQGDIEKVNETSVSRLRLSDVFKGDSPEDEG